MQQQSQQPQQQDSLGFPSIQAGLRMVEAGMGFFAQTTEIYWHKPDAGERYHNFLGTFGKAATYGAFLFLAFTTMNTRDINTIPLSAFFFGAFLLSLMNQWTIWRRNMRGERCHSRYAGTPWLWYVLPLDPFILRRWVEPWLTIAGGMAITQLFNESLGAWLILAGGCQGMTEKLASMRFRTMILDMIDRDIEAKNLRAALIEKKDAKQTEGFIVPSLGFNDRQRAGIFRGLAMRYEEWRDAYARQKQEKEPKPQPQPPSTPPQEARSYYVVNATQR